MNGLNLEGIFRQAMMRSKSKNVQNKRNDNPEMCINCKEIGMIKDIEGLRICTNCGFVNPGLVEGEQGIKNEKQNGNGFQMGARVVQVHNKNNKIHIHAYSEKLLTLIYPYRDKPDQTILGEIHGNVLQFSKKKREGFQGMNMYVIVGIFLECALIKNKVPIVRPKLIEYITMATNSEAKRKAKTFDQIHNKYNEYRGMKEIKSIIKECIDRQPSIGELTKYLVNDLKFSSEAKEKVKQLVTLLSPKNKNNNIPDPIANKSNNTVASFIVCVVAFHQNILPPNAEKVKKVYGVSTGVITNMYKALFQIQTPFKLKPVNELFKTKQQKQSPKNNIKNFIIQIGDKKRRCNTYPKNDIRNEAIARGLSIANDKKMTKESLCILLKQHQLAGA